MADSTDPYAGTGFEQGPGRLTKETGGSGDQAYAKNNIINSFLSFGYYPTEAEVAALTQSSEGVGGEQTGAASVATYVNYQKAEVLRQQDDPLAALQKKMQESSDLMKNQVKGLYTQLQDTLSSAPQLFGNLTPDQIQTYLAPLQGEFQKQLATVQGTIASRGLSGSSTENNALAATDEQFKESTLSQGLQVGMQTQQNKAAAIQKQISDLLGLTSSEEGIAAGAAGQRSSQNLGQSNLIQSLPFFLDQAALQRQLINKQQANQGGFFDTFNKVTGAINRGTDTFQNLAMIPSQFKSQGSGGAPYGAPGGGGPNLPPNAFQTSTADTAALFATA